MDFAVSVVVGQFNPFSVGIFSFKILFGVELCLGRLSFVGGRWSAVRMVEFSVYGDEVVIPLFCSSIGVDLLFLVLLGYGVVEESSETPVIEFIEGVVSKAKSFMDVLSDKFNCSSMLYLMVEDDHL